MNSPSPSPRIRRATHRWPAGGPALGDGPDAVDAVELRRAALEAAACAAGADAAVLLRCLVWDDACYFHGALATDGQLGAELAARWEGGPAATRGWDPRRPMRGTNRRFRSGRAGPRAEPWLCERLGAQPIGDQATTMVFDGARFVALVACLRVGRARFANAAIARLNAARPALCEALVGAERAEIAALEPALTVVLDAAGAVVAAMGRARVWLARDGREAALAALVRVARDGAGPPLAALVAGSRVVLTRADECGRVVATIGPPRVPLLAAVNGMTRRQREVADLAAAGATSPEIARALGIGDATVRAHLKDIYRRFRIGSRVELVNLLHDTAPDLGEDLS